jgi:hypothetical protein
MANIAVKSTLFVEEGVPDAMMFVWYATPPTVQTTTSASPSASETLTETVAIAPVGESQLTERGKGQVMTGGVLLNSYAPMSMMPPTIRANPRWSVGGATRLSPALIAGLPQSSACVKVGPPLFCNGPSFKVEVVRLNWSPGPGKIGPFVVPNTLNPDSISP